MNENVSAKTLGKTKCNRTLFVELSGRLTNNETLTLKYGGNVVNEYSNEQNGERFKARFRKEKYYQNVLNHKYQEENTISDKDKSIELTNLQTK